MYKAKYFMYKQMYLQQKLELMNRGVEMTGGSIDIDKNAVTTLNRLYSYDTSNNLEFTNSIILLQKYINIVKSSALDLSDKSNTKHEKIEVKDNKAYEDMAKSNNEYGAVRDTEKDGAESEVENEVASDTEEEGAASDTEEEGAYSDVELPITDKLNNLLSNTCFPPLIKRTIDSSVVDDNYDGLTKFLQNIHNKQNPYAENTLINKIHNFKRIILKIIYDIGVKEYIRIKFRHYDEIIEIANLAFNNITTSTGLSGEGDVVMVPTTSGEGDVETWLTKYNIYRVKLDKFTYDFKHSDGCKAGGDIFKIIFDICDFIEKEPLNPTSSQLLKDKIYDLVESFELLLYYYIITCGYNFIMSTNSIVSNNHVGFVRYLDRKLNPFKNSVDYKAYVNNKYQSDNNIKLTMLKIIWKEATIDQINNLYDHTTTDTIQHAEYLLGAKYLYNIMKYNYSIIKVTNNCKTNLINYKNSNNELVLPEDLPLYTDENVSVENNWKNRRYNHIIARIYKEIRNEEALKKRLESSDEYAFNEPRKIHIKNITNNIESLYKSLKKFKGQQKSTRQKSAKRTQSSTRKKSPKRQRSTKQKRSRKQKRSTNQKSTRK